MAIKSLTFRSESRLRRQLLQFFIVSITLLSVITALITTHLSSVQARQNTIDTGLKLTSSFAEQVLVAAATGSVNNSQDAIDATLQFHLVNSIAIYTFDENEKNVLIPLTQQHSINGHPNPTIPIRMEAFQETAVIYIENDISWIFSAPIYYEDTEEDEEIIDEIPDEEAEETIKLLGHVFVEVDKSDLHELQYTILFNNLLVSILGAIILAFIMKLGIDRLTKPLVNLSDTMQDISEHGNYHRVEVTGARELQELSTSFNEMIHTLEEQQEQIRKHRDSLETEVTLRTQDLIIARDSALTASRHKSEFLATISHELRTPLQGIIGYADLIREELEVECMDHLVIDLNKIVRSANSLLSQINNLLDFTKIEAGKMDLNLSKTLVSEMIDELIETVSPLLEHNQNKIVVVNPHPEIQLHLDRQKVLQMLLNLVGNACKFTEQGTITITIDVQTAEIIFSVRDTGIGIPEAELDKIFNEFQQVDNSESREYGGTGLGLAITKKFCNLMKGEIHVESHVGEGTNFTITLPIQQI